MGRTESQGIYRAGKTVLTQVGGVSDITPNCWLCGSVGEGSEKDSGLCPPFCLGESCPPSYCLDSRHFSFSLYATGAFQATTLVLELRGSVFE